MMRKLIVSAALALALPTAAHAQGIAVLGGAYIPASSFADLKGEAETVRMEREGAFALGLNLELGSLRGTLRYATEATLDEEGVEGGSSGIESGTLLAASADFVLRPLPRVVGLQPYVLGGVGLKRMGYSYADDGASDLFPESERELAAHWGLGVDFSLGGIGLVVEADDFVTWDDGFGAHDAFIMAGVRLGI